MKCHPGNERIKRHYREYLEHADGKSSSTIRQVFSAISKFEVFTEFRCFRTFSKAVAIGFKQHLKRGPNSMTTNQTCLRHLKHFFGWLHMQKGYKRNIRAEQIQYLNLSRKEITVANAGSFKKPPTLAMIRDVVSKMPHSTSCERRDRAMIAFTALTGVRVGALISLKLRHFDLERLLVIQDPNEVNTKFSKRILTFLFPIDDMLKEVLLEWVSYLKTCMLFSDIDPLFPKTERAQGINKRIICGDLSNRHWASGDSVRKVFKDAFVAAGHPPHTPHTFRNMIVAEMYARDLSIVQSKAWSQNLGHESANTTLGSYGELSTDEQGKIVGDSTERKRPVTLEDLERLISERDRQER